MAAEKVISKIASIADGNKLDKAIDKLFSKQGYYNRLRGGIVPQDPWGYGYRSLCLINEDEAQVYSAVLSHPCFANQKLTAEIARRAIPITEERLINDGNYKDYKRAAEMQLGELLELAFSKVSDTGILAKLIWEDPSKEIFPALLGKAVLYKEAGTLEQRSDGYAATEIESFFRLVFKRLALVADGAKVLQDFADGRYQFQCGSFPNRSSPEFANAAKEWVSKMAKEFLMEG